MSVSGVKCHQSVVDKFNEFKKKDSAISYMVCKIEEQFIQVEEAPARAAGDADVDDKGVPAEYKQLESTCITAGCRYGFYIFKWESAGGPRDIVVLIQVGKMKDRGISWKFCGNGVTRDEGGLEGIGRNRKGQMDMNDQPNRRTRFESQCFRVLYTKLTCYYYSTVTTTLPQR